MKITKLKLRRIIAESTQIDIQNKTNISSGRYSLIENGYVKAKTDEIEKISKVLNATVDDIINDLKS